MPYEWDGKPHAEQWAELGLCSLVVTLTLKPRPVLRTELCVSCFLLHKSPPPLSFLLKLPDLWEASEAPGMNRQLRRAEPTTTSHPTVVLDAMEERGVQFGPNWRGLVGHRPVTGAAVGTLPRCSSAAGIHYHPVRLLN